MRVAGRFRLVDLEPGNGLGGGPGDVGDQAVLVVDPPGGVSGFHGGRTSSMDDADVDPLPGNDQRAAAGHPPLHAHRLGGGYGWRTGRAGVQQPGLLGGGERVGQAAQQHGDRTGAAWCVIGRLMRDALLSGDARQVV
jgi:hypothetical protein